MAGLVRGPGAAGLGSRELRPVRRFLRSPKIVPHAKSRKWPGASRHAPGASTAPAATPGSPMAAVAPSPRWSPAPLSAPPTPRLAGHHHRQHPAQPGRHRQPRRLRVLLGQRPPVQDPDRLPDGAPVLCVLQGELGRTGARSCATAFCRETLVLPWSWSSTNAPHCARTPASAHRRTSRP